MYKTLKITAQNNYIEGTEMRRNIGNEIIKNIKNVKCNI